MLVYLDKRGYYVVFVQGGLKVLKRRIKSIITVILYTGVCVFLSGCVSQKTFNELTNQLESLKKENSTLSAKVEELNKELDEIKNGPTNLLYQANQLFEAKKYDEVIKTATTLHQKFNGSPEDVKGQQLASQSQKAINEAEQAKKKEEERVAAEAKKSAQDKARAIIRVFKISTSKPNSAGGVDLFICYTNMSDKVIKYATFTITPYNKVGDEAIDEIRGTSTFRARDEGPHKKQEGLAGNYNWYWENAWYNWTIARLELNQIEIEYMDGTSVTLSGDDINYVQY